MATTIDLKELCRDLGAHYDPYYNYKGDCDKCGEEVTQLQDTCPACGEDIIWKGSKVWNDVYLAPTSSGYLFRKARTRRFRTGREALRWKKITQRLPEREIRATIDRCYGTGKRGRGLVKYALNALEAAMPPEREDDDFFIG